MKPVLPPERVEIMSITDNIAMTVNGLGQVKSVLLDIQRTGLTPKVGEAWLIDRTVGGHWTFAARVSAVTNTNTAGIFSTFAGDSAPPGYLFCDGSYVTPEDFPNLYSIIGYTYGRSGLTLLNTDDDAGYGDVATLTTSTPAAGNTCFVIVSFVYPEKQTEVVVSGFGAAWSKPIDFSTPSPRGGVVTQIWTGTVVTTTGGVDVEFFDVDGAAMDVYYGAVYLRYSGIDDLGSMVATTNLADGSPSLVDATITPTTAGSTILAVLSRTTDETISPVEPLDLVLSGSIGVSGRPGAIHVLETPPGTTGVAPQRLRATLDGSGVDAWTLALIEIIPADERKFRLPTIADPTLGGHPAHYIISTGE